MAEAASICFESQGHSALVLLRVEGDLLGEFDLLSVPITEQMRDTYVFETSVTEKGACGVSILVLGKLLGLTVVREAPTTSHFDYWLAPPETFLFQGAVRLEVSGIRKAANDSEITSRATKKRKQIDRSEAVAPGYVAVVEFSRPLLRVTRR
jgi:hypothetical protein